MCPETTEVPIPGHFCDIMKHSVICSTKYLVSDWPMANAEIDCRTQYVNFHENTGK